MILFLSFFIKVQVQVFSLHWKWWDSTAVLLKPHFFLLPAGRTLPKFPVTSIPYQLFTTEDPEQNIQLTTIKTVWEQKYFLHLWHDVMMWSYDSDKYSEHWHGRALPQVQAVTLAQRSKWQKSQMALSYNPCKVSLLISDQRGGHFFRPV